MKILILGLNYAPELVGIGPYTAGMARSLAAAGHQVSVVAGKPYYPDWAVAKAFRGGYRAIKEGGVSVTRCPIYVPASPSGTKRLLHHASFALSAAPQLLSQAMKMRPDVVIAVAPSLVASPVAWLAARLSGAKLWLHVQDFEVEAAFATGLLHDRGLVSRAARAFENAGLAVADQVSSISPQMCRKLVEKGISEGKVTEFRNWADLDAIKPLGAVSPFRNEWGIDRTYVALYSGNIANKQGMETIVEAAERLQHRRDLLFVVCGNGSNRQALVSSASHLGNIVFKDLQPTERLSDLLGLADVHLLPQIAGAADLVLPSKLTNMLASGRPIVATAIKGSGIAQEVEGCGLTVPPGDSEAFARSIEQLIDSPPRRIDFGTAARARAEQRWGREAILGRFQTELEGTAAAGRLSSRAAA